MQLDYQLPNFSASSLSFSPDGKLAACFYKEDSPTSQWRIAILPIEGGKPVKTLDIPPLFGSNIMRWAPDGQALAYINDLAGVSNIWLQPLNGGQPRPLTNFNSERILYFDWSRDGKNLACVRGYSTFNIVLISNFK